MATTLASPVASFAEKNRKLKTPPARWRVKATPGAEDEALAAACGISRVSAAILRARGFADAAAIDAFFNPTAALLRDPLKLPDMKPAIERLHRAITTKEPLLVFGDYDVDGVTSTALLVRSLRALGANVAYTVPERHEGYGLSIAAVERAAAAGTTLILTADCGITAHDPVRRARELGIDVVITDHHDPGATLPAAVAVINPKRADSQYGFRELCGCAVAFKLMLALLQEYWPQHAAKYWPKFVELVGLALVADCVPLVDENRFMAGEGLRLLAASNKTGLQALMKSSGLKISDSGVSGRNVGFVLAPRLNAAGRIASPQTCLTLLLSNDAAECAALAAELEDHNKVRQELTATVTREAIDLVYDEVDLAGHAIIVVAREGWSHGVMGLAASRLAERFARPAIVLCIDEGVAKGSGRSIPSFDLHGVLDATRPLLFSGGGHHAACGLALATDSLEAFREQALHHAAQHLAMADLVPSIDIDCRVGGADLSPQLLDELARMEPCGIGNPEPSLLLENLEIVEGRSMGNESQHLKWKVKTPDGPWFDAVWWRPGPRADGFNVGNRIDLCFSPQINEWNGRRSIQLVVKDARVCGGR